MPTLVAMTTLFLLPVRFSQLPIIVSDSPPLFPGTHLEYISAVSTRLKPDEANPSRILKDVFSSMVHPKTLPPKASGATCKPDLPSSRFSMLMSLLLSFHQVPLLALAFLGLLAFDGSAQTLPIV